MQGRKVEAGRVHAVLDRQRPGRRLQVARGPVQDLHARVWLQGMRWRAGPAERTVYAIVIKHVRRALGKYRKPSPFHAHPCQTEGLVDGGCALLNCTLPMVCSNRDQSRHVSSHIVSSMSRPPHSSSQLAVFRNACSRLRRRRLSILLPTAVPRHHGVLDDPKGRVHLQSALHHLGLNLLPPLMVVQHRHDAVCAALLPLEPALAHSARLRAWHRRLPLPLHLLVVNESAGPQVRHCRLIRGVHGMDALGTLLLKLGSVSVPRASVARWLGGVSALSMRWWCSIAESMGSGPSSEMTDSSSRAITSGQ
ncbi:Uncharacterized protein TCAP_07081 [Tolypocladium capitatum]|uniref:Uncharacterized protein n=1 Tax=Tolypocladium capitatum TaxID=45235 RepID=A0A2K3Q598_9HYPO|nr:Uncharacterized protein TCAP_07081 [Tolypocladium capitatum]